MTDAELERLERLEKAATPGPWNTTRYSGGISFSGPLRLYSGTNEEFGEPDPIRFENEANIYLIAAARNALPELIAEIRRLRAESQRLEFLMQFFGVEDVGDESVCPGVVVDTDAVGDAFNCGALVDERVTLMDGWQNPDMRRVIDKAIAYAEKNTITETDGASTQ